MQSPPQANGHFYYPPVSDTLLSCELYLTSIGTLHYPAGTSYPSDGHPGDYQFSWKRGRRINDYALVWIAAGEGEKELSTGRPDTFTCGEAIFLMPGAWHRYRPAALTGWTEHWLCLNGEHLQRLRLSGFIPDSNASLGIPADVGWQRDFERLFSSVVKANGINQPHWGATALQILLHACEGSQQRRAPSAAPADTLIQRALLTIRENAHRNYSVKELAAAMHPSPRTLERHFAESHIRSPRDEIIHVRIRRACRLLANPDIPIKQIAFTCGFGSAKLMNYNFQRLRQTTPGAVRREAIERQLRLT